LVWKKGYAAIAIAAALLLAACGNGSGEGQSKPSAAAEAAVSQEPVELTFYTSYSGLLSDLSDEGFMKDFGQYMQKKYPNFTFKTILGAKTKENLATIVASKTPIDIVQISPVQSYEFVDLGIASDISDLIKKNNVDVNAFEPSAIKLMKGAAYNQLVGLPYQSDSLVLFYNKDIFDKFAVPYPKDDMTWDQMTELVRRVTRSDGGIQYAGFASNQSWANVMRSNQFSLEPLDPKTLQAAFTGDRWKQYLQTFIPIFQIPGNEKTEDTKGDMFVKDKSLAMYLAYPEYYQRFPAELNWDVVSVPKFKDLPGVNSAPVPLVLAPAANSPHRDAAFLAIKEMASKPVQLERARKYALPSVLTDPQIRNEFGADVPALKGKNTKVMQPQKMAGPITFMPYTATAVNGLRSAFNTVLSGKADLNTALRDAAEDVNKKVAEMKVAAGK
jgi:multiple sugar transport system substrate-binding protein